MAYFASLTSGLFQGSCKLQAYLCVRLIYMGCNNYPVFSGNSLFLLQCTHLNVTIQEICTALSCFISKTGVRSLETKGKVSSACCTCRNLADKIRNTFFFPKTIVLLSCPSVVLIIYLLNLAIILGFCKRHLQKMTI